MRPNSGPIAELFTALHRSKSSRCWPASLRQFSATPLAPTTSAASRRAIWSQALNRQHLCQSSTPSWSHSASARSFSLRSLFQDQGTVLKTAADKDPQNAEAQIKLLEYWLARGSLQKEALSDLVLKYEGDTHLFDDSSAATASPVAHELLQSKKAWDVYLQALVQVEDDADVSPSEKVESATARREAILKGQHFVETPLATTETTTDGAQSNATPAEAAPGLSSAQIASAALSRGGSHNVKVLNDQSATPQSGHTSTPSKTAYAGSSGNASSAGGAAAGAAGKAEPIRVVVEEARGNLFFRAVRFLLVVAVYSFVSLTLISLVIDGSGLMRAGTNRSPVQEFQPQGQEKPVTFADVHGCEEAKFELQEVVDFLKDPEKFSKLGGRLPKGVLLTGPPGTGKTLLARAVAGEAGVSFLFASGSEFDELFVGVGAKRVRELFETARKNSPCIIFIDELDAIGSKRSPRDAQHMRQTLNQLLTELDGFQQSEGVILIGATNLPNLLDKALTRPGRFDRHVTVPLPDVRGRLSILQHHVRNITIADGVNLQQVARGTPGFSGAQLENLVNQAAVRASRQGESTVNLDHIEWAKDKILMGAERLSAVVTPESRKNTAFHEAGHALVALYTKGALPLHRVTVIPRGQSLGHTLQLPEMDRDSESFTELRARLDVAMGGRAAEELMFGKENITSGASSDISNATMIANAMVRQFGFSDVLGTIDMSDDEKLSSETKHQIENEVRKLVEGAGSRAMALLKERSHELQHLADGLVEYETLSLSDVRKVVAGEKLDLKKL